MPTYKIDGQIIERTSGKILKKVQVTLTVTIKRQIIQETKAKVEQDGFFRMSFSNEFIPVGTKAKFRVEDQDGNNLPTDFSLALRPGQHPVRVKIPVNVRINQYTVQGTITNQNQQPLKGLLVRATDQKPDTPENMLGTPVYTDDKGKYKIIYKDEDFRTEGRGSGGADIIIRVFSPEGKLLGRSEKHGNSPQNTTINMNVNYTPVPAVEKELMVSGKIQLQDGQAARQFFVQAFDKDLRSEELLGEGITDRDGKYIITYSSKSFIRAERGSADIFIKVFDPKNRPVGVSDIFFNASARTTIDFQIKADEVLPLSEFELIQLAVSPLLAGVKIIELDESEKNQDISFLSGETGYSNVQIQHFVQAHYFEADSKIAAPFWYVVLGISFYEDVAFNSLEEQRGQIAERLSHLDERGIRKALRIAFANHKIETVSEEVVEKWMLLFENHVATLQVASKDSFAKKALEEVGISGKEKQVKFARAFNKYKTFSPELIDELKKGRFKVSEINDLQTTYELSGFTNADFEMVKSIKQKFDVRDPKDIRFLAKKSQKEWTDLAIESTGSNPVQVPMDLIIPKDHQKDLTEIYGKTLHEQFITAFPTMAFSGSLDRALESESESGLKNPGKVKKVIDSNPDFEFLTTPIDEFARQNDDLGNDENLKLEFKAVQRVFKLTPDFEATNTLMTDNLHSAHSIYRMGESEFIRKYENEPGFTREKARVTWRRAEATHAASTVLVAELKATQNAGAIAAFKAGNDAVLDFPNWNNLFKGGDICECKHCRSVYSPAAYFTDLLMFLKDRRPKGIPANDILFSRRPDLGYLELNCENANVTLPYIDVVNEVLEAVVADGENDHELAGFTSIDDSDLEQAREDVLAALQGEELSIGENIHLARIGSTDRWVIHSDTITYLLKKKGGANNFAEILRNTKAKAEELRANPQYVNPVAYQNLSAAKFPFALPFDLFGEEVKASFYKVKVNRWKLMQLFKGNAAPNNATEGEVAAVYFGISVSDEKDIILQASPTTQFEYWGENSNAALLNNIKNVKTFLSVTGLEYNQLLSLLDLQFINPDGTIQISHLDPTCDTDQKELNPLDVAALDRINRFLRLWRKLGWKMWEVDLVIRQDNIGNESLNELFLINLMYLVELKNKLGKKVSVEQVCSLFGNLNTTRRFTELHEKRADAIYQELFLHKKLINPLDLAFEIPSVDLNHPDFVPANVSLIKDHKSVVQAALRLKETDLDIYLNLTKPSDGSLYLPNGGDGDLILPHLSFLYRHSFLANSLKIKTTDWNTFLKIYNSDVDLFTDPKSACEFIDDINLIQSSEFKMDELNYLLTADLTAKAASHEATVIRFLISLRNSLKEITKEFDPAQYEFLQTLSPNDIESLESLLNYLLLKNNLTEGTIELITGILKNSIPGVAEVQIDVLNFQFPDAITGDPGNIPVLYKENPTIEFSGVMSNAMRGILLTDASLPASIRNDEAYIKAIQKLYDQSQDGNEFMPNVVNTKIIFADNKFPDTITGAPHNIPIQYQRNPRVIFTGLMTDTVRDELLGNTAIPVAVRNNPEYQAAIQKLHDESQQQLLNLKFFAPEFKAALENVNVDFEKDLPKGTAIKVSFNAEEKQIVLNGILSQKEKELLDSLDTDPAYLAAINNIYLQQSAGGYSAEELWIDPSDLDISSDNFYTENLALAIRGNGPGSNSFLEYFKEKETESVIIQQLSDHLGIAQNIIKKLIKDYQLIGTETIFEHFKDTFTGSLGVVDYAGHKDTFDTFYWMHRVSLCINRWELDFDELEWLFTYHAPTQTLDFASLPFDDTDAITSLERVLRTEKLLKLNVRFNNEEISILSIVENLHNGHYAGIPDFAGELEVLTEWDATDVVDWINHVDLTYHADYLLAENWIRLYESIKILEQLNVGTMTAIAYANPTIGQSESQSLKQLLRSKYGAETWLTISTEIQDVLRERKRDALAAYILAQPQPADAPSGKWENTNDLYAYYLLDVEMSSCMLTSRLVQGSGSIQLFVQRCFMGLEPEVPVKSDGDDGDSAWRWWKWMRKYRVWEANRKVFLYPENWIEPELRPDKSSFFQDLENELLQNEATQLNVEQAYLNYLDKLNEVARLDIAAFYHEDDADQTIVHVFGRTAYADPHIYYYRQFDYRRWTPWEKIEVDIVGDHLIPLVVNKRLFLYWPEFREEPDDTMNNIVPIPDEDDSNFSLPHTYKKTQIRLATTELRNGKWLPKKVSNDYYETNAYTGSFNSGKMEFYVIDKKELNGKLGVKFTYPELTGYYDTFELFGCEGLPVKSEPQLNGTSEQVTWPFPRILNNLDYIEKEPWQFSDPESDFQLEENSLFSTNQYLDLLLKTPTFHKSYFAWQTSYLDRLLEGFEIITSSFMDGSFARSGSWLPFFYADREKTFMAFPLLDFGRYREEAGEILGTHSGTSRYYYPEIKAFFRDHLRTLEGNIRTSLDSVDFTVYTDAQRVEMANFLAGFLNEDSFTTISAEELKGLIVRFFMTLYRFYFGAISARLFNERKYHFKNFYHPFVCDFIKLVYNPAQGIPAMMSRNTQMKNSGFNFGKMYDPTNRVYDFNIGEAFPKEIVDFSPDGSYSPYNWELFYHTPLMIANSLSKNQRFEEAMEWYHYIFNPIGVEGTLADGTMAGSPQKYWITKPFFLKTDEKYYEQRIDTIMRMIAGDTTADNFSSQLKADFEAQVRDWRYHPFEPHRIAQYRDVAYQKTVFMKYLDNLIAWGDHLFRQDSMESINEATQLYILSAELLGPRPKTVSPQVIPPIETFNELEDDFDDFSNARILIENYIPALPGDGMDGETVAPIPTLYFCIPQNDKISGYWDIVADRLYKIRNCMNIEGVVRQLSLFEPEIDPGALVKAVAGGMDISSALADLNSPLPYYRFNILLQKANEVCSDVKALGGALLSALEKKDAEKLALLRQEHELQLLEAVKAVRELQIDEAKKNLDGLKESLELTKIKIDYYSSREFMNAGEIVATVLSSTSIASHTAGTIADVLAGVMFLIPDFKIGASGFGGSPHFAAEPPTGNKIGESTGRMANGLYNVANILDKSASMSTTIASYQRRQEEWDFQKEIAEQEKIQLEEQIEAADIRIRIVEKELANQELQTENSKEVEYFIKSKYTNKELYQWMIGQISQVYFKSYQLAYDMAKRAERCYRFELGIQDSNFIKFGYWDSLKKGLLAGDKLQYHLRRLETSYLEQNRRELELTKHISLALLDPLALIKMRETGKCFFSMPEEIFDLDYPGHYFRRIKSVSISLPCVMGPYTTISCSLRLLNNRIRVETVLADGYVHNNEDGIMVNDSRFVQNNIPIKAIATSSAQNDSGIFELNFRDERYLPFEGAGVVSGWTIDLFNDPNDADFGKALRQFDYKTISDAIIHVRYTAREAGGLLKDGAIANLREYFGSSDKVPGMKVINLKHDFPSEWHKLLHPNNPAIGNVLEFKITRNLFPYRDNMHTLKINDIKLIARCSDNGDYDVTFNPPLPAPPPDGTDEMTLTPVSTYGNLHFATRDTSGYAIELDFSADIIWNLTIESPSGNNLAENELEDMYLFLGYEWEDS